MNNITPPTPSSVERRFFFLAGFTTESAGRFQFRSEPPNNVTNTFFCSRRDRQGVHLTCKRVAQVLPQIRAHTPAARVLRRGGSWTMLPPTPALFQAHTEVECNVNSSIVWAQQT